MKKCSPTCVPVCMYCTHAEYERIMVDGIYFDGEAIGCKLHPEEDKVGGSYFCDDFCCFLTEKRGETSV